MAMEITDSNFKELVKGNKPLVVDFWAEWCGPCRMIAPIIEELAHEYEESVIIGKLNVDENNEISAQYGIRSIPTILFFKGDKLIDKLVGAASKNVLDAKIKALL
jgi:thioredoxin 1